MAWKQLLRYPFHSEIDQTEQSVWFRSGECGRDETFGLTSCSRRPRSSWSLPSPSSAVFHSCRLTLVSQAQFCCSSGGSPKGRDKGQTSMQLPQCNRHRKWWKPSGKFLFHPDNAPVSPIHPIWQRRTSPVPPMWRKVEVCLTLSSWRWLRLCFGGSGYPSQLRPLIPTLDLNFWNSLRPTVCSMRRRVHLALSCKPGGRFTAKWNNTPLNCIFWNESEKYAGNLIFCVRTRAWFNFSPL